MAQKIRMKVRRNGKSKGVRVRKSNVLKDEKSGKIIKTPHSIKVKRVLANMARNRSKKSAK